MDIPLLVEAVAALVLAAGTGGGVHAYHKRRNGPASGGGSAQEEVLRQGLHDQRHGETLRILGEVTTTCASSAKASERAAKASEESARITGTMATLLEERLPRR